MSFEEKIERIYKAILSQNLPLPQSRITKSKEIVLTILHAYRYKQFDKVLLQKTHIINPLCIALTQNLIDVADIYILNAFVKNLTIYSINIEYIRTSYASLSYTMNNCESDVNILT